MRRAVHVCVMIALAAVCAGCWRSVNGGKDVEGYYWVNRNVPVYDAASESWRDRHATDCLRIKAMSDGRVGFQVNLVETNDHLCSMTGVAAREGGEIIFHGAPEDYPNGCVLRIEVLPEKLVLHDDGSRCRQYACGARAVLDGIEFSRANRTNGGPVCVDEEPPRQQPLR